MEYPTSVPPFYSSFTPPFYSTVTTIPAPLPNFNFSHGYTPPSPYPCTPSSPNPYPSSTSYSNPYGYGYSSYYNSYQHQPHPYSSYYNHEQQPPLPYSQPQPPPPYSPSPPHFRPPPYQHIDVIQKSFDEILQTSQRSLNEFKEICQKSTNDLRASNELIKASQNSIKASFQEIFESSQRAIRDLLQEHVKEELVEEDTKEQPEETEFFLRHEPPPEREVQLAKVSTESFPSEERKRSIKTSIGVQQFNSPALRPPPPKPPESGTFKGRNGSFTAVKLSFACVLVTISLLKQPDDIHTPAPPPKPPDPSFQKADSTIPLPPPKPPDLSSLTSPPSSSSIPLKQAIPKICQPSDMFQFYVNRSQPLSENTICVSRLQPTDVCHVSQSNSHFFSRSKSPPLDATISWCAMETLNAHKNKTEPQLIPSADLQAHYITAAKDSHVRFSFFATSPNVCPAPASHALYQARLITAPPAMPLIFHAVLCKGGPISVPISFSSVLPINAPTTQMHSPPSDLHYVCEVKSKPLPISTIFELSFNWPNSPISYAFFDPREKIFVIYSGFQIQIVGIISLRRDHVQAICSGFQIPFASRLGAGHSPMHSILEKCGESFLFNDVDVVFFKQWDPGKILKNLEDKVQVDPAAMIVGSVRPKRQVQLVF